ncbi:GMC oxidoreductase [Brasilonema sp. UFV-L1]|uniref:GMC oxidoreductase n=1 Tax=Brasilonema sp. UFV-L1 TaxID=2234130 RepID=UPI00145D5D19|nr:GMC oxidoreductase [Brasilonema sp. UFV-L1]NMG09680.1 GMC family oxidoreductase [Brasilonema sp. UFV-L1]
MFHQSHGRRQFLQNAAIFSTGLMASLLSDRPIRASDESVEAIVIGSGFGGAVAALRLGQAGINTLVLERGRRWPITPEQNTFATYRKPDGRAAWLSPTTFDGVPIDVYTGVLESKDENGITVLSGAGVGGGSLVYNGTTYQPPRQLFYYPRVRSMLKASPIPQDILNTSYYDSTRFFLKQATIAGLPYRLVDAALDWDIIRQQIQGTKIPDAIIGENWYGFNSGAKNSLDRNYLAQAEQTGHINILPLHLVTAITEVPRFGYRVFVNEINESGEVVATKTFTSRYLFLAAGSIGTSALLVKAKATNTLPRLNEYVGLGWGDNGDSIAVRSGFSEPTNPSQEGGGFAIVQHFDNPIGPISIQHGTQWNAPEGNLISLGMGIPTQRGKFNYDSTTGLVKLTWPVNSNQPKDTKVLQATEYTYKLLNKKYEDKNPITVTLDASVTGHPLGGAVLGKACDFYGRVMGYPGLYVVDSALIPGSTGCTNPSFTIAALAERNIERILLDDIVTSTARLK